MMLTKDIVKLENSGYTPQELQTIFGGRTSWTVDEVLGLDLPSWSLLWFAIRPEFLSEEILHEFACDCCDTLRPHAPQPEKEADDALAAKREWLASTGNNKDNELKEVWKAAHRLAKQSGYGWSYYLECCAFAAEKAAAKSARGASWAAAWGMAASKHDYSKWDDEIEKERTRQVVSLTGIIRMHTSRKDATTTEGK
jgi:hypothetical protein